MGDDAVGKDHNVIRLRVNRRNPWIAGHGIPDFKQCCSNKQVPDAYNTGSTGFNCVHLLEIELVVRRVVRL
jgi:hypothetical protein